MDSKSTKPFYKKWQTWVIVFLLFAFIGFTSDNETEDLAADNSDLDRTETSEEADVVEVVEETESVDNQDALDDEEAKRHEAALRTWEEDQKNWWLNEYAEYGVVDIQPVTDSFSHVNVIVTDELKLLSDNEKEYFVDLVGSRANNFVSVHFEHYSESVGVAQPKDVYVDFYYSDGKLMARQKVTSQGWDIK